MLPLAASKSSDACGELSVCPFTPFRRVSKDAVSGKSTDTRPEAVLAVNAKLLPAGNLTSMPPEAV